jgi:uncharacterized membrane protein
MLDIAIEIYGVIGHYWATLAGFGRPDLSWLRRGVGMAWSVASLPIEFVPLLVGVAQKRREARNLARCRLDLAHASPTLFALGVPFADGPARKPATDVLTEPS